MREPGHTPIIGVLALQGGFAEHIRKLQDMGMNTRLIKKVEHLNDLDGVIIPGGESTTLSKLLERSGLLYPLQNLIISGIPVFGTCAGFILLAYEVLDTREDAQTLEGLNITIRRNAFGSQAASFETQVEFADLAEPVDAVFIRAPKVEEVGLGVEILSTLPDGSIVAVRQQRVLGCSFHPELTADNRVHEYFIEMVRDSWEMPPLDENC